MRSTLTRAAAAGALAATMLFTGTAAPAMAAPASSTSTVQKASSTTKQQTVRGTVQKVGQVSTIRHTWKGQPNGYYCGPTSLHIALGALGVNRSISQLAQQAGTTRSGTKLASVARVMNANTPAGVSYRATNTSERPARAERARFASDLSRSITSGYPVIVNIAARPGEAPSHYPNTYRMYHHFVAVGYDAGKKRVLISDPAYFKRTAKFWVDMDDLIEMTGGRGYAAPVLSR